MNKLPLDPWGQAYRYARPGIFNPEGVDVYSVHGHSRNASRWIGNWPSPFRLAGAIEGEDLQIVAKSDDVDVTEQAIGGASFVRVDVPAVQADGDGLPAFTKLLGAGSIYAISPCTEETAKAFAARARARAFSVYEAPRLPAPTAAEVWADPNPEADPDDDYEDPEDDYDEDDGFF